MRVVTVTAPKDKKSRILDYIYKSGIKEAEISDVLIEQKDKKTKEKIKIEISTSTLRSAEFIDNLVNQKFFNTKDFSITSDEVRSIIASEKMSDITIPMITPKTDLSQELWVMSHLTPSYLTRAFVSALILSYGMIQNSSTTMVAAFLFTPFLSPVLAISYGLIHGGYNLARQGFKAILVSTTLTFLAGLITAQFINQNMQYDQFDPLLINFLISLIIGTTVALASRDDAGLKELIAIAAVAQFAIFPAWLGITYIDGLPGPDLINERITIFAVNFLTILSSAGAVYFILDKVPGEMNYKI